MKGSQDYDLWGFDTEMPFQQFSEELFKKEIHVGKIAAVRVSEIVKIKEYEKPEGEGFQPNYY
jgi:hypothetical protein